MPMYLEVSPCLKINNREIPYTEMVKIPAKNKSFLLYGEKQITFDRDFWVAQYPVTQQLYEAVMGENSSSFKGKYRPIENVTWEGTQGFLKQLNSIRTHINELPYRLGSEAMWKYAAMADNTDWDVFVGSRMMDEVGFYNENSANEIMPVGLKEPNAWGLYDMSGNIWEWCEDYWSESLDGIPQSGWKNKVGDSAFRIIAGGSWTSNAEICLPSLRNRKVVIFHAYRGSDLGFRLFRY